MAWAVCGTIRRRPYRNQTSYSTVTGSNLPLSVCSTPSRPGMVCSVTERTGTGMTGICPTCRPNSRLSLPSNLNQPISRFLSPDLPGDFLNYKIGQFVHILRVAAIDDDIADGDAQTAAGALGGGCAHGRSGHIRRDGQCGLHPGGRVLGGAFQ